MKLFIRKILGYFGFDIIKKNRVSFIKKEILITVGGFPIKAPAINPLISTYTEMKDFGNEIARIVVLIYKKYSDLSVLDIGANIGDTVATIKSVANVPIICVEGDDFSFSYLIENTKQFSGVKLYKNYLGEREETVNFTINKKGWNSTLIPDMTSTQQINLITLDQVMKNSFGSIKQFKFLKIDTEGYDTIILRGSFNLLKIAKPTLYFEYNQDNMANIHEDGLSTLYKLKDFGYEKILFFDDKGRFILSSTLNHQQTISELSGYANGRDGLIYYYNLCIFHREDNDIAEQIILAENKINLKNN